MNTRKRSSSSHSDRHQVKRRQTMAPPLQDADHADTSLPSSFASPVGRVSSPRSMHPSLSSALNSSAATVDLTAPFPPPTATSPAGSQNSNPSHPSSPPLPPPPPSSSSRQEPLLSTGQPSGNDGPGTRSGRASPPGHLHIPKMPSVANIALSAMQYLPTPLLVLSSLKTVIFANDAMGKLLGLDMMPDNLETQAPGANLTDRLLGQSLGQIGIDLVQDSQPVWVSWERFLDGLSKRSTDRLASSHSSNPVEVVNEDIRSLARESSTQPPQANEPTFPSSKRKRSNREEEQQQQQQQRHIEQEHQDKSFVQDTVVDVLLSSQYVGSNSLSRDSKSLLPFRHVQARMVISIWHVDGQQFYSLAFSAASPALPSSRSQIRMAAKTSNASTSPSSAGSLKSALGASYRCVHCGSTTDASTPPARTSPSEQPLSLAPFPLSQTTSTPSALQRTLKLKDAIINGMQVPKFAMWRDESVVVPNKAAEHLMRRHTDPTSDETLDPISRFVAYTDDFSRRLSIEENPIVLLCRTQKPFKSMRVGYLDRKGKQIIYDVSGECLYDETGEFIGGMTALKDVTELANEIREQSHRNDQQFELICDCMPQIAWTTTPGGGHDWFSKRWYEYTGLSEEQSLGEQWTNVFHPEDMPETERRWRHSLATGDEYVTEYRARSKTGEWRWMLGRALPLKDQKTGRIVKWFGTCTDIDDLVQARQEQKRTHEQLLNVIEHAKVTVWSIDREKVLTFLEGPLQLVQDQDRKAKKKLIGRRIEDAFGQSAGSYDLRKYVNTLDRILKSQLGEHVIEHHTEGSNRWYRTRFVPILGKKCQNGRQDDAYVDGVVGVSQDVSEVKMRELELQNTERENLRLLSAETAAKDASRLKSQFLANMSHEIRTPIAGVIGMAELLVDTPLDEDQRELAENIQRSANGLLTVINDILDLSKVESGRLEIESVQFNLSVVLRDVGKMMSFAAAQKGLGFDEDCRIPSDRDLILIGDPNRCRQILMNLLTNSIKFTQDGSVKLAAWVHKETSEALEVTFAVEDTGEGIEEEVKKKLFRPFTQADSSTARRFGGTGLGLTICKNLVDLMRGSISLNSVLGQGTKARFTIPFTKPQVTDKHKPLVDLGTFPDRFSSEISMSARDSSDHVTPPQTPLDPSKPGSFTAKRAISAATSNDPASVLPPQERQDVHILVVEDNPVNQQIATRTIKKLGFSVDAVDNGKQALEYILKSTNEVPMAPPSTANSNFRRPNVILMDVQMPVLDGYRATHQIRHHDPFRSLPGMNNIPIVAMTASAIQGDKEKCQRAGMDDYLAKPVKSTVLEQMLVKWAIRNRKAISAPNSGSATKASTKQSQSDHDSNCTETDLILAGSMPPFNQQTHKQRSQAQQQQQPGSKLAASPSFPDVMSPPPESEGDRGLRRQAAEEKARALRDDKLVNAAESDEDGKRPRLGRARPSEHVRSESKVEALTEENLGNMNRERESSVLADQPHDSPDTQECNDEDVRVIVEGDGIASERALDGKKKANEITSSSSTAAEAAVSTIESPPRPVGLNELHQNRSGSSGDSLQTNAGFVKVGLEVPSGVQGSPKGPPLSDTSSSKSGRLKAVRLNSSTSEKTVTPEQYSDAKMN